jgi:hypothetical protein
MQGLWRGSSHGLANRRKFFRCELDEVIDVDSLLLEAYILVKRANFTYSDVKTMSRTERTIFLKLLREDLERENDAIKRSTTS